MLRHTTGCEQTRRTSAWGPNENCAKLAGWRPRGRGGLCLCLERAYFLIELRGQRLEVFELIGHSHFCGEDVERCEEERPEKRQTKRR